MPTARMTVNLTWTGASGSPGANVWHMRSDQAVGPFTDFDDMSQAIKTFYTSCQGLFPTALNIQMFGELQGVGDDTGDIYSVDSWGLNGSGGVAFLPPANCMLVNWKAATGGRSGRGKTFLGPLVTGDNENNGTPDEARRTTVSDAAVALIAESEGLLNGGIGVYSRTHNVFRDYVSADVPNFFAVLRTRRD